LRRPIGTLNGRGNVHAAGSFTNTASGIAGASKIQFDAGNGMSRDTTGIALAVTQGIRFRP
jgi:hypothetical protein